MKNKFIILKIVVIFLVLIVFLVSAKKVFAADAITTQDLGWFDGDPGYSYLPDLDVYTYNYYTYSSCPGNSVMTGYNTTGDLTNHWGVRCANVFLNGVQAMRTFNSLQLRFNDQPLMYLNYSPTCPGNSWAAGKADYFKYMPPVSSAYYIACYDLTVNGQAIVRGPSQSTFDIPPYNNIMRSCGTNQLEYGWGRIPDISSYDHPGAIYCSNDGNTPTSKKYSCSGATCYENPSGPYTNSWCDNMCQAPQQRYSCLGTSCNPDPGGPYTNSWCNNQCQAPQQRYDCSNTGACVQQANGRYDNPTCGGVCSSKFPVLTGSSYCNGSQPVNTLSWSAPSGTQYYRLYRIDPGYNVIKLADPYYSTSYTDSNISSGTTYTYEVQAYNNDGTYYPSNDVQLTKTCVTYGYGCQNGSCSYVQNGPYSSQAQCEASCVPQNFQLRLNSASCNGANPIYQFTWTYANAARYYLLAHYDPNGNYVANGFKAFSATERNTTWDVGGLYSANNFNPIYFDMTAENSSGSAIKWATPITTTSLTNLLGSIVNMVHPYLGAHSGLKIPFNCAPPPAVSVTVNGSEKPNVDVKEGDTATVTWDVTNKQLSLPTSCTTSGNWSLGNGYDGSYQGSFVTNRLFESKSYTLRCFGPGGEGSDTASANVVRPTFKGVFIGDKININTNRESTLRIEFDPKIPLNPPPGFSDIFAPLFQEITP